MRMQIIEIDVESHDVVTMKLISARDSLGSLKAPGESLSVEEACRLGTPVVVIPLSDEVLIAADMLDENGFPELAEQLRGTLSSTPTEK